MTHDDLIVIGGAGGFIGGALTRRFHAQGFHRIRAVDIKPIDQWYQVTDGVENVPDCDLELRDNCFSVCKDAVEVYNFAADMGGMGFIELNKADCMLTVLISTHMLLAAKEVGKVERFFYSSSACAYNTTLQGKTDVTALKETDAYPAMAEDGYGWEKLFTERMCRHFREDFGIETRVARFHNVYGPNGTWDGGREKAPSAICRKVIAALDAGSDEIEIWGDGKQTRSFMYIDDCTEGIDRITHGDFVDPINLGSAELVSINYLSRI